MRSVVLNLAPLNASDVPKLSQTLKTGWIFLIPLGGLVTLLILGYTPTLVAAASTALVWLVSFFKRETRLGLKGTIEALSETTVRMLAVTGACAAAGLVIGGITMTGLASKFSFIAFALAGDHLFLALLLSAIVTIILGLGMPTPSAYVLAAVLVAPTLVNVYGFHELNAHLFLLYFAVMSAMTPPVAVAAYAAGAISSANPLHIAVISMRFSVVAFVVPFIFVFNPMVLSPFEDIGSLWISLATVLACILIAVSCEMQWFGSLELPTRLIMLIAALALSIPDPIWKISGATIGCVALFMCWKRYNKFFTNSRF